MCHSRDVGVTHADKLDHLNWPKTLLTDHQNVLRKLVRPGGVSQMPLNLTCSFQDSEVDVEMKVESW